jgi:hypothetical protein
MSQQELDRILSRVKNRKQRRWLDKNLNKNNLEHHNYWELGTHVSRHGIRDWLLKGARKEGAVAIATAVARLPEEEFNHRFARMLAKDYGYG